MQGQFNYRALSFAEDDEYEKLELFVSCRNLSDLDIITATDSFLMVSMLEPKKPLRKIPRTRVYDNSLNPDYAETVIINYFFQITQKLILEVYHLAEPPKIVGKTQATVGQVLGAPNNGVVKPLLNNKNEQSGDIILRLEKVDKMNIGARHLPEPWCLLPWCHIDSFFRIFRQRASEELNVYESEVAKKNQNPELDYHWNWGWGFYEDAQAQ